MCVCVYIMHTQDCLKSLVMTKFALKIIQKIKAKLSSVRFKLAMALNPHLIDAQSLRGCARRTKDFQSLLPCPLLRWSDGTSHSKFSSPELIKGTCRIVHQADGRRRKLFLFPDKIHGRKKNKSPSAKEAAASRCNATGRKKLIKK